MNKKTVFKFVGCVLGGIILILVIVETVREKVSDATFHNIMENGHPTIASNNTLDVYYCKNEEEEGAVIFKIATDKYKSDPSQSVERIVAMALTMEAAQKIPVDLESLDLMSVFFSNSTSIELFAQGYYVIYLKESESICVLYLEHDKQLVKLYGQSLKAANLKKSWLQEFSIKQ